MFQRLAFLNMKRSMRDYLIYFITLSLTAAFMYSFLALGFSGDILAMSENMSMLTTVIVGLSVFVAWIASFVIGYAVRFMLMQRKKELAVYELLGMETRLIQKLFLLENGLLGLGAFGLGAWLGIGLSGILVSLVNRIFETPHTYRIVFSGKALAVAFLFFVCMYGMGMMRSVKIIRRSRIIELLYDSRKREQVRAMRRGECILWILLSVCDLLAGGALLVMGVCEQTNLAFVWFGGAGLLTTFGIYSLYRRVPQMLLLSGKRKKKKLYAEARLFYLGQIGHRVSSAGRLMAMLAILLSVSLATMFAGLLMGAGYKANMQAYYPYDAGIALDAPLTKECMEDMIAFTDEKSPVSDAVVYYLYRTDLPVEALAMTDYNHLRRMLGLAEVSLADDSFLVHCDTWNYMEDIREALAEKPEITLAGTTLHVSAQKIYTEPMELYQMAGTKGYVLVVPDAVAEGLSGDKIRLVMSLADGGYPELKQELKRFLNSGREWRPLLQDGKELPERVAVGVTVKAWGVENSLMGFTAISFGGLYLSVIFILLASTMLAFEQLSGLEHSRRSYGILEKLGVEAGMQRKLARSEVRTFFFVPAVLPVATTVCLMAGVQRMFGEAFLRENLVWICGSATLAVFGVVYLLYYLAANSLFCRAVLGKGCR